MERRIFRFLRWNRRRGNDEDEAEEEEDSDADNDEAGKCILYCRCLSLMMSFALYATGLAEVVENLSSYYFRLRVE